MSNIPADLRYSKSHEWARVEGPEVVVGITDHAQESLSDVVFVELPTVGAWLSTGDMFGVVESVKAASELYSPIGGTVSAVNDDLNGDPAVVNADPYGSGWMMKLIPANLTADLDALLNAAAYEAFVASGE